MQKGRVGREEGEKGQDVSARRARGGFDHWAAQLRQQRTHAVGRCHQAGVTSSKGGIRDITGIRGRDRAEDAMIVTLDACGRRSGPPNLIVDAPFFDRATGQRPFCDYWERRRPADLTRLAMDCLTMESLLGKSLVFLLCLVCVE